LATTAVSVITFTPPVYTSYHTGPHSPFPHTSTPQCLW
jgi:hypothetical protein